MTTTTSNGTMPAGLAPRHANDLRGSGLSDRTIETAQIYSTTDAAEINRLLNWKGGGDKLGACMVMPYLDLHSKPEDYAALKPDRPLLDKKRKPRKYELPRGGGNRIYIPAGVGPLLADPAEPLLITEGIKKALAATQE